MRPWLECDGLGELAVLKIHQWAAMHDPILIQKDSDSLGQVAGIVSFDDLVFQVFVFHILSASFEREFGDHLLGGLALGLLGRRTAAATISG